MKPALRHFPQYEVPEKFLPPPQFRNRSENQAFIMDTVQRGIYPPENVEAAIFAHTHIHGAFVDPHSGKTVINAGVLHASRKSPMEPRSFALYYPAQGKFAFVNAETKQVFQVGEVERARRGGAKAVTCEGLF
jgi:hypothetical protein